jgi:hypothetical protein
MYQAPQNTGVPAHPQKPEEAPCHLHYHYHANTTTTAALPALTMVCGSVGLRDNPSLRRRKLCPLSPRPPHKPCQLDAAACSVDTHKPGAGSARITLGRRRGDQLQEGRRLAPQQGDGGEPGEGVATGAVRCACAARCVPQILPVSVRAIAVVPLSRSGHPSPG